VVERFLKLKETKKWGLGNQKVGFGQPKSGVSALGEFFEKQPKCGVYILGKCQKQPKSGVRATIFQK
jgi:hypothetical protein